MLRFGQIKNLTFSVVAALSATVGLCSLDSSFFSSSLSGNSVFAQDGNNNSGNRRGNRNWNGPRPDGGQGGPGGQWGGRNGGPGGQWGGRNGGQGGENRRGFGNFTPEMIRNNMNQERFNMVKNTPFAGQIREAVGNEVWERWNNGDFSPVPSAAEAAAKAQDAKDGKLEEIPDLTDEERKDAEERLRGGTVPEFTGEGVPHYSIESEAEYYRRAMARRSDVLVDAVPIALRYYARFLMGKYDQNGDGALQRNEWENRLEGAQAIDLNGDWELTDQEILFFLTRFAKDRTIFNPNPVRQNANQRSNFLVEKQDQEVETLIRPASAAPKRVSETEAQEARLANDGNSSLADLSDEDFRNLFNEGNPALESVDNDDLLGVLLSDMDESNGREYAAPPVVVKGAPVWFLARDKNGDGQLTILEFAPSLSQKSLALFGKYDQNGDEIITADEARKGPSNN